MLIMEVLELVLYLNSLSHIINVKINLKESYTMKKITKIFLIVSSIMLVCSTKNLSAVKNHPAQHKYSFQESTKAKKQHKISKTSKSSKIEPKQLEVQENPTEYPEYNFKKVSGKKICSYISHEKLDENQIYMVITNINHNIDVISEKLAYIEENEMDNIRIQFNNCTPEIKNSILEFVKSKKICLASFYSREENILLVNLNLPYHGYNIKKVKSMFRKEAPTMFEGKKLKMKVLENVGQIIYNKKRQKFNVSFGNAYGDLLFKISKYFYEKHYKVWCRKESKSMSISAEGDVTYEKIKNELNDYIANNPLYVPHADEILEF